MDNVINVQNNLLMSGLYDNKYRIDSARLPYWDYRNVGAYFITICTYNMEHYFGTIKDGEMELSNIGAIANVLWAELRNRTKNVRLGEFNIMPNHIHGILILKSPSKSDNKNKTTVEDANVLNVETLHATSLHFRDWHRGETNPHIKQSKFMSKISPKNNSVSTIIRSYKSAVTKHANRLQIEF